MKNTILLFVLIISVLAANAQSVGINSDGSSPNSSAMLDVMSTTKGFLAPRVASTADVTLPATGLLVYQTGGTAGFYYYTGSAWTLVGTGSGNGSVTSVATGTGLTGGTITTTGTLSLANTAVTAGSYTRATITIDAQGRITAAGDGAAVSLTSGVTGTLPIANGGTNATTASAALTNLGAAPLASPTFTGTPSLPTGTTGVTQTAGNSTTALATTAFVNTAAGVHAIGDNYMGGKVFFVYDNGTHGLIAATADQGTNIAWSAGTLTNTMALALGVGGGSKNTAIIIANQGLGDGTNYAARVCNEYKVTINSVDYGDWYLPSHAELTLLYYQRSAVLGFSNVQYWSSTEVDQLHAYNLNFGSGVWANYNLKSDYTNYSVRAIRAF